MSRFTSSGPGRFLRQTGCFAANQCPLPPSPTSSPSVVVVVTKKGKMWYVMWSPCGCKLRVPCSYYQGWEWGGRRENSFTASEVGLSLPIERLAAPWDRYILDTEGKISTTCYGEAYGWESFRGQAGLTGVCSIGDRSLVVKRQH